MGETIDYGVLPSQGALTSCGSYQPQNDANRVRENLKKLDPNQDGKLKKAEVKKALPLLNWEQLEVNYNRFYQDWLKFKAMGVEACVTGYCSKFKGGCLKPTPFTQISERVIPAPQVIISKNGKKLDQSQHPRRMEISPFEISLPITLKRTKLLSFVHLEIPRLHPIKDCEIKVEGEERIVVTIGHYSGKKTILLIERKVDDEWNHFKTTFLRNDLKLKDHVTLVH